MLNALSWLALTPLLLPHNHPPLRATAASIQTVPLGAQRSTDTIPEPPLVLLTDSLVTQYLAIRPAVFAVIQKDQALAASLPTQGQHVLLTLQGPGGLTQQQHEFVFPNFVALAKQNSAVAAIFKQHGFAPSQFVPVTLTIRKALFAEALHEASGWAVKDPTSVAGKNIAFVAAHAQAFAGSGLEYNFKGQ